MEAHWTHTQRVMGEVLIRDDKPNDVWEQHQELLEVVVRGQAAQAERLAKKHILDAADFMIERLRSEGHSA
jgi:DNA-binding GntR family transcriptional regulator